jgi:3'(2'), 5'-bisphosphate nucleotidase
LIQGVYQGAFEVDYKGPNDPVTAADRLANELICRRLQQHFPGVPIVAEESDPATFGDFIGAERVFFVDPVDGTREFVARNGEFVSMIGLVEGERPTLGLIHAPALGVSWIGIPGHAAWQVDAQGHETPMSVSSVSTLASAKVLVSRSHASEDLEGVERVLGAGQIARLGSAGLKGAHVACGIAEAYVAPGYAGKRWDAAAAEAIVVAAQGRFTDATGASIDYRAPHLTNDRGIVASNGALHEALLERLALARA